MLYNNHGILAFKPPSGLGCCTLYGGGSVVDDSLFIVAPIVCGGYVFGPCFVMQCLVSFLDLQSS